MDSVLQGVVDQIEHNIGRLQAAKAAILTADKNGNHKVSRVTQVAPTKKRSMSAAARKRIGDATRKRWAAQRKQKETK